MGNILSVNYLMPSSDIKVVATDLDNTLVYNHVIPPANLEAIKILNDNNILFLPVTGRGFESAQELLKQGNIKHYPGGYHNGALTYCPKGERIIDDYINDKILVEEVSKALDETNLIDKILLLQAENVDYVKYLKTTKSKFEDLVKVVPSSVDDKIPDDEKVYQLGVFVPWFHHGTENRRTHKEQQIVLSRLQNDIEQVIERCKLTDKYMVAISAIRFISITRRDSSKARAIKKILEHYDPNLSISKNVLTLGDAANDIPMMQESALSVAMINGLDCVKEIATTVSEKPAAESGWAFEVNKLTRPITN